MQPYGIMPLTIEPDGLQYRVACDLTIKGKQLIEKALGVVEIQLEENWDYGTNAEPHLGSIMLSPAMLLILGVFALFDDGCHEVWATKNQGLIGLQQGDPQDLVESLRLLYGKELAQQFVYPTAGNWNRNAMALGYS
jgi:hypothetical protein